MDLVEWQLLVASGEPIPLKQEELSINGWAIEARLYAEDPSTGFLPSTGRLELLELPEGAMRVETGVEEGDAVSPYYDPMIAKMVAFGHSREEAMLELAAGLFATKVWPVRTNAAFLLACLNDPVYRDGAMTTGLIGDRGDTLTEVAPASDNEWQVAALQLFAKTYSDSLDPGAGPWQQAGGFRLNRDAGPRITVQHRDERRVMELESCVSATGFATQLGEDALVYRDGQPFLFTHPNLSAGAAFAADGAILAPMPGKVIAVDVAEGDKVTAGQRLMVLEAMKMEHALTAPFDGTVTELSATTGGQVQVEAVLAVVEPDGE